MSDGEHWDWREHPGVTWAAGLAAAALLALLVVAVIETSDSSHAPGFVPPAPDADTSTASAYTPTSSATPTYAVPSVQTSQDSGAPTTTSRPSTQEPSVDEPTVTTSTTASNPYGTTTPTNAGHV